MSKKPLPFEIDAKYDIMSILKGRHEIPYHSRPFMWERNTHIETVVRGVIEDWRNNSIHWLGFIIIYSPTDGMPAITDGQHRITICFLMIRALAELLGSDEPLQWISQYGTTSILGTSVPAEDQAILSHYDWTRFPNIHSVYDHDFEALGNILNDLTNRMTESKIYAAYDDIKDILTKSLSDEESYKSVLRFLHEDIKVTRMTIEDWEFAMNAFNSLNNIKVQIPNSIVLKNRLTHAIGMEHSEAVHTFFNVLAKKYGNKMEFVIEQMMNMQLRVLKSPDEYKVYLASPPDMSTSAFVDFQKTAKQWEDNERLFEEDRFGKILLPLISGHEVKTLCLQPIAFIAGPTHVNRIRLLLRQLSALAIRTDKPLSFNGMKMQTPLRDLVATAFEGKITIPEIFSEITRLLKLWSPPAGSIVERISTELYKNKKFSRARAQLLYMAEATDCHEASLDHSKVHIDHIYAKTRRKNTPLLETEENTHRIGNLTPLCGANSEAGMKGNSSLSNKEFSEKIKSYAMSNIAMTRDVSLYPVFLDTQIEERSLRLAQQLDDLTAEDLAL